MPSTPEPLSVSDRLLAMATEFARQGRPAMAEAARLAAVRPAPPIEWCPPPLGAEPSDGAPGSDLWTA